MSPGMNPLETLGQHPPGPSGLREGTYPGSRISGSLRPDEDEISKLLSELRQRRESEGQRNSFDSKRILSDMNQLIAPPIQAPVAPGRASAEASPYNARVTGPVRFINRLLVTWKLDSESACILLGFEPSESAEVSAVLQGHATLRGRDAKDRIAHLFRIRSLLAALFRDEAVENEWLREPRDILESKSPMDLLMEGSMENLLLVREVVEVVTGR